MNICDNCGQTFDVPKITIDYDREITPGNISIYYVSPCCGEDYSEAKQCMECGKWFSEQFIENGVCAYCMAKAINQFKQMVLTNFSKEQIEFIDEQIELAGGLKGFAES